MSIIKSRDTYKLFSDCIWFMIYLDVLFNKEGVHIFLHSFLMKLILPSEAHLPFSYWILQLCCKDPFCQRNACFKRDLQLASFAFVLKRKLLVYNDHWSMVFYFPFHIFTSKDGRRYFHFWNQPCPPRLIHFPSHMFKSRDGWRYPHLRNRPCLPHRLLHLRRQDPFCQETAHCKSGHQHLQPVACDLPCCVRWTHILSSSLHLDDMTITVV